MKFQWREDETPGQRIARCCEEALRDGPMGRRLRPEFYRTFISCGFDPPLQKPHHEGDIGGVKTSCGIFVRGALHWSGRRAKKPGKVGGALIGGWLEGLSFAHDAWVWAEDAIPEPGAVFYRDYSRHAGSDGHTGIFVRQFDGSLWVTAEGGGSDANSPESRGTVCRMTDAGGKDVRAKDSLARRLIGWWKPAFLRLDTFDGGHADTDPAPARELKKGMRGEDVKDWQKVLLAEGHDLGRWGADGVFGKMTEGATVFFQQAHDLLGDPAGVVGPKTRAAAEGDG